MVDLYCLESFNKFILISIFDFLIKGEILNNNKKIIFFGLIVVLFFFLLLL